MAACRGRRKERGRQTTEPAAGAMGWPCAGGEPDEAFGHCTARVRMPGTGEAVAVGTPMCVELPRDVHLKMIPGAM